MRCGHFDGPQRFRIEPLVSMTQAEHTDRTNLPVDDREFKFATGRRSFDVSPSRGVEKAGQGCNNFFHVATVCWFGC